MKLPYYICKSIGRKSTWNNSIQCRYTQHCGIKERLTEREDFKCDGLQELLAIRVCKNKSLQILRKFAKSSQILFTLMVLLAAEVVALKAEKCYGAFTFICMKRGFLRVVCIKSDNP